MISYLQKFNSLPKPIRDKINDPAVMARISELGSAYKANLASTVMRVMAGEIRLENLGAYLINDLGLSADNARALEQQLRRSVFSEVLDYLLGPAAGAKLVFSEHDESEVRKQAQPLAAPDFDAAIEQSVQTIVEQSRVNFSDPLGSGKFRQVMKTYLRGTRDRLATLDSLIKPAELGGIALSRDTAERVMILAGNFLSAAVRSAGNSAQKPAAKIPVVEEQNMPIVSSSPKLVSSQALASGEYTLEASLTQQGKKVVPATPDKVFKAASLSSETLKNTSSMRPAPSKPIAQPFDVDHELMPPAPAIVRAAATLSVKAPAGSKPEKPAIFQRKQSAAASSRQVIKEAIAKPPLDKEKLRTIAAPLPAGVDNTIRSASGKVIMNDVRHNAHAQSPIDELKDFTLVNFRRLDPDPAKAIVKLRDMLENLGREDYGRKIEGIVAWQQSPLNRLYLLVCRKSLDENVPISAILDRERKKEPTFMRPDELSAIISLNRSLKF